MEFTSCHSGIRIFFIFQVGSFGGLLASSRVMEGERSRAEKYPSSRFGKSIWVEVPGNNPLERDFERDNPF